jgi:hypothetical protein
MLSITTFRVFLKTGGSKQHKTHVAMNSVMQKVEAWWHAVMAVGVIEETASLSRWRMGVSGVKNVTGLAFLWATVPTYATTLPHQFFHIDVMKPQAQMLAPVYPGSRTTIVHKGKCAPHSLLMWPDTDTDTY